MTTTTSDTTQLPQDQYWAAVRADKLPDTIRARALLFRRQYNERLAELHRASERCYYGFSPNGDWATSSAVAYGGEDGEQVRLHVNHYRSIVRGVHTTVMRARPSFESRAVSTDTAALAEAQLTTAIVESYWTDKGIEAKQADAALMSLVLSEGWTALRWNPFTGRRIGSSQRPVFDDSGKPRTQLVEQQVERAPGVLETVQTEQPVTEQWPEREGDVEVHAFAPIEVVRDLDDSERALTWVILPYRESVWELVARYPQHRARLLDQRRTGQRWPRSAWCQTEWQPIKDGDDFITVWWLYHMPTSAMPEGRQAIVAGDLVLFDGPMRGEEIPVYGCIPELQFGSGSGYSSMWDLLALCTAYNAIMDVMLSSHDALGMQNVIAPKNTSVQASLISRGLQLIKYDPKPDLPGGGKPEPLQLLAISGDSYKLLELLQRLEETLSGLNAVARGDAPANLKSGNALALVQSMAVSYNSHVQAEVVRHNERVATGVVKIMQRYASDTTPRLVEIAGKTQRVALREWTADSIKRVSRVKVEISSPVLQQESGRMQVAQDLLKANRLTTPQEYLEVLTTGRLEPMYESTLSRVRHIRTENELLQADKPVTVGKYDDHGPHVWEHLGLLDSPEARSNDALVRAVAAHIDEHVQIWLTMPPPIGLLTRQTVMPPGLPAPMPGGPPGPTPPHDGPPPAGGPDGPKEPPAPKAQPLGQEGGPNMPSLPRPAQPAGTPPIPTT